MSWVQRRLLQALVAVLCMGSLTGCFIYHIVKGEDVGIPSTPVMVETPVKVHLEDGSVAVFREGARFEPDRIAGPAIRYAIALDDSSRIDGIPIDSVVAIETFEAQIDPGRTVVVSALGTAGGFIVAVVLIGVRYVIAESK